MPKTVEEVTTFIESIGNTPFDDAGIEEEDLPKQQPIHHELADVPTISEVIEAMMSMKDSEPGEDEISILLLRTAGPRILRIVAQLVRRLWQQGLTDDENNGMGFLLWKGKQPVHDLNDWRVIWLLSMISRIFAKVVQKRLNNFAETNGLLSNTQWGFRRHRSTQGPVLILRLLLDLISFSSR